MHSTHGTGRLFQSTFRLYGEGIRLTARQILLDAHAANNVNFQTDYDKRIEKIGAVVDGCSLLLEYLTICTEEGIISAKKAGIWTKKVTERKIPGDEVAHVGTRTCRKTPDRSGTETADRTGCRPESCPLPGTVNARRATALHKGCGLFV